MGLDDAEVVYDEIPIADLDFDEQEEVYTHACPCGDVFVISVDELREGSQIAHCNDCSLKIRVLVDDETKRKLGLNEERRAETDAAELTIGAGIELAG
mmetsp:Transcript_11245/g.33284  ORF Transcript_11245/g.33284 Transcript_11245/m.33284 type:complete len:98 (-) Transcript_11245:407-700(-)